jgi:hypothetical protein
LAFGLALLLTPFAVIAEHPSRATVAFGSIFAFAGLIGTLFGLEILRDWRGGGRTFR